MTEEVAYRFIEALAQLEQNDNLEPMVSTFADACEIGNSLSPEKFYGKEGAVQYWSRYRASFRHIRSTFLHIIRGEHSIALEWSSSLVDVKGKRSSVEGVTILDVAGGQITRFRAYMETRRTGERIPAQSECAPLEQPALANAAAM